MFCLIIWKTEEQGFWKSKEEKYENPFSLLFFFRAVLCCCLFYAINIFPIFMLFFFSWFSSPLLPFFFLFTLFYYYFCDLAVKPPPMVYSFNFPLLPSIPLPSTVQSENNGKINYDKRKIYWTIENSLSVGNLGKQLKFMETLFDLSTLRGLSVFSPLNFNSNSNFKANCNCHFLRKLYFFI